jgi:phenylacetate-CoA ligase
MVIIRGVNVFPSALENVLRRFPEIEEFRIETFERASIRQLKLIIEPIPDRGPMPDLREKIAAAVRDRIGLRPEVELVAPGSLPRFELKAKRFFKIS